MIKEPIMKKNILLTIALVGFSASVGIKASDNGKTHDEGLSFHNNLATEHNCYESFIWAIIHTDFIADHRGRFSADYHRERLNKRIRHLETHCSLDPNCKIKIYPKNIPFELRMALPVKDVIPYIKNKGIKKYFELRKSILHNKITITNRSSFMNFFFPQPSLNNLSYEEVSKLGGEALYNWTLLQKSPKD